MWGRNVIAEPSKEKKPEAACDRDHRESEAPQRFRQDEIKPYTALSCAQRVGDAG